MAIRHEVHIFIHHEGLTLKNPVPPQKRQRTPTTAYTVSSNESWQQGAWWSQYMSKLFEDGYPVWKKQQEVRSALGSGESVEYGGVEMDEARLEHGTMRAFSAARNFGLNTQQVTQIMIERASQLTVRWGVDEETVKGYIVSRIDLLGKAYNKYNLSQLKAMVFQQELKAAS